MIVISVDLDDTLIPTQVHYESAKNWFGDYVERLYGIDKDLAIDEFSNHSSELLDTFGLSKERLPRAAMKTLRKLADNPDQKHLDRSYEIGRSVFKSKTQYSKTGFMDKGTKAFLETIERLSDQSVLLTAGDLEIQSRKVEALNLNGHFDEVQIVDMGGKSEVLKEYSNHEVVHIGNSSHSDMRAASESDSDFIYIPRGEWVDNNIEYSGDGEMHTVQNIREAETVLRDIL